MEIIITILILVVGFLIYKTIYLEKCILELLKLQDTQDELNMKLGDYICQNREDIYAIKRYFK